MDTYTILREFADSWWLIAMTAFFIGQVLWTLRPGSAARHAEIAAIPLRNDELPLKTCTGQCNGCVCDDAALRLPFEEVTNDRA